MTRFIMFLLSLAVSAAIIMSCEGPAGPKGDTGATGANGTDGKDASLSCTACHGNDDVEYIMAQYDLSRHNKGVLFDEFGGILACASCHTGDGFAESVALNSDNAATKATSKINCQACHQIHEKFTTEDFALRVNDPITLRKTGAVVDFKNGNTCARCHQARPYNDVVGADTLFPGNASYTRFGPHYGTPANVFSMKGLYEIPGSTPYPSVNVHANLAKGCVSCHMGSNATNPAVGGHSFKMTSAQFVSGDKIMEGCACHSDKTFFTAAAKQKEIAGLLKEYRQILIDRNLIDTTQAITADGYQLLGEYLVSNKTYTNMEVKLILNYFYVNKDRSNGVHNPAYVTAIVKNGLEELKK